MDELRKKFKRGQIDKKTYQEKLTELTIFHLKAINYKYVGKIAEGAHGVVVEMKSPETVLNVAVKIVCDDFEHGLMSWPTLIHENVLPLITWRVIWQTNSKAFITLKYDKTLRSKISSFRCDFSGFEKAIKCIRDITNGINYLHHQGLCHLNLNPDRIFIDYNNKAKIGGFGYLASKDTKKLKFGTTAVFHPPEAYRGTNRKIDGQKFDIWSLGILAIETFTGQYLSKEMSKWQAQPETWYLQLYGLLYEVLEKENFNELVKKHLPNWKADDEKLDEVLKFIQSCLMFNPEDRPSADDLLELRLMGGYVAKFWPMGYPDIWAEMVSPMDLVTIASEKRNMSDSDTDSSDDENNNSNGEHLSESNVTDTDIKIELSTEREKVEKDFENLMQKTKDLDLICCEENISYKEDDSKETTDTVLEIMDATVEMIIGKGDDWKKEEHEESSIMTDVITDEIEKTDDTYKNNASDNTITLKFEESFISENSGQKNIVDSKCLIDDVKVKNSDDETKENDIHKMNMSFSDNDEIEAKIEIEKIDKDLSMKEKTNDIKKECEEIKINEHITDNMNVSNNDGGVVEDKSEIIKVSEDLNIKEYTNDVKNETIKVEIIESDIDKLHIEKNDRDVKKSISEYDKHNKDLNIKRKSNPIKKNVQKTEVKEKFLDIMSMSSIDEDVKKEKNEFDEKSEGQKQNEEKNDTISEKIAPHSVDSVQDRIDEIHGSYNNVKPIESSQYKRINDPVIKTNTDSDKNLPDNFDTSKNKRMRKRRSKKSKPKILLTNSSVTTDEELGQISYNIERMNRKQFDQTLSEEYESSLCDEIPKKYNVNTLHQRSRKRLSKAHPNDKHLKVKEYQHSNKSSTESQFIEKFNADIKINQKSSLYTSEKRDDTNNKQKLVIKTHSYKCFMEKVEEYPVTSCSDDQRSIKKTYSPKCVVGKFEISPVTSHSEEISHDDESYDLEPGEVPLFKKDYDKILDEQGPDYSVASLSGIFTNDDEEDLEEGEVNPNNPGSNYDSQPTRIRRRLKHLRSWWKRQKKKLTSCFTACFCKSDVN